MKSTVRSLELGAYMRFSVYLLLLEVLVIVEIWWKSIWIIHELVIEAQFPYLTDLTK